MVNLANTSDKHNKIGDRIIFVPKLHQVFEEQYLFFLP